MYDNHLFVALTSQLFQKIFQLLAAARVSKLAQHFRFNLANPLSGNAEHFAHFLKRTSAAVIKPKTKAQYALLPLCQCVQHTLQLLLQ